MTTPLGDGRNYYRRSTTDAADRVAALLGGYPSTRPIAPPGWQQHDEDPARVGNGPDGASTCTDLDGPLPMHIWDVNCYYADLGVSPRATRKELMRAYQRHGNNPSARTTYVFKQLLDPDVRRAYDLMPLGSIFIDQYVHDEVHRQVKLEMARRMWEQAQRRERDLFNNEKDVDYEDVLNEMGFRVVEDDESLDTGADDDETPKEPSQARLPIFPWSYYLWRSKVRVGNHTAPEYEERLARWQGHLVRVLSERKVRTKIAVGFCGRMAHPYVVGVIGGQIVVFLNDVEEPNLLLAQRAADRVVEAQAQLRHRLALRG